MKKGGGVGPVAHKYHDTYTLCRSVFASADLHSPDPNSQDSLGFPQNLTLLKLIFLWIEWVLWIWVYAVITLENPAYITVSWHENILLSFISFKWSAIDFVCH